MAPFDNRAGSPIETVLLGSVDRPVYLGMRAAAASPDLDKGDCVAITMKNDQIKLAVTVSDVAAKDPIATLAQESSRRTFSLAS